MLARVELEIAVPGAKRDPITVPGYLVDAIIPNRGDKKGEAIQMPVPRVQKLRLTEASEKAIFGDLHPWRDACLPPLFKKPEFKDNETAYIDEEQAKIYNNRVVTKLMSGPYDPEEVEDRKVKPGMVKVTRSRWDVLLRNL